MKTKKSVSKASMLIAVSLLALPVASSAQDSYVDSLWNAANAAYVDGRWTDGLQDMNRLRIWDSNRLRSTAIPVMLISRMAIFRWQSFIMSVLSRWIRRMKMHDMTLHF